MRRDTVHRLFAFPYNFELHRDAAGNVHVTLYGMNGTMLHTIVAPTFDEAVTVALYLANKEGETDA